MKTPMNLGHALAAAEQKGGHFLDYMKTQPPAAGEAAHTPTRRSAWKKHRPKLSPKSLKLPSAYRTTAWAEVALEPIAGVGQSIEIARFESKTPGHVVVFASQDSNSVTEISERIFMRFLTNEWHPGASKEGA